MLTVGRLKTMLKYVSNDAIVTDEKGESFNHIVVGNGVVMSKQQPIGYCKYSGEYVYPNSKEGFSAYSLFAKLDLKDNEWIPFDENDSRYIEKS